MGIIRLSHKVLLASLLGIWCLIAVAAASEPEVQPISLAANSGFEELTTTGTIRSWSFDSWQKKASASIGQIDTKVFHSGKQSIRLTNFVGDDSRFIQYLVVKPATWYHFGVWIKTEGLDANIIGASISLMEVQQNIRDLRGNRDWTWVEVYGKTGPNQKELPLALRLGFYGNNARGSAWFDDLLVETIPAAPSGASILSLYQEPAKASDLPARGFGGVSPVGVFLIGAMLVIGFLALAWRLLLRPPRLDAQDGMSRWWFVAVGVAALLLVKLVLAASIKGYPADIGTFSAWAMEVFRLGPAGFYRPDYFADYPPAYFYVLWLVGALTNLLHTAPDSPLFLVILKLPAILGDVAGAWILFRMAKGRAGLALHPWFAVVPLLWLLSPLASFNSSVWGQVDSVFSLVLLAAFWKLEGRKLKSAGALLAIAVLLKPQALLVAPLALLWLVMEIVSQVREKSFKARVLFEPLGAFLATAFVLALPFAIKQAPDWIFQLYANTFGSYDYASLNAANIWYLLGLNWAANSVAVLGMTLNTWGWIGSLGSLAAILACLVINQVKKPTQGAWLLGAFAVFVVFFGLATKMHERYLFPAALLGFGAFQLLRDRRVFWAAVAAACICFLNVMVTLQSFLATENSLVPSWDPLMLVAAIAMVGLVVWTLYLCFDILVRGRIVLAAARIPAKAKPAAIKPVLVATMPQIPQAAGRRKAIIAVGGLTLVYGIVALWGLGSHISPQRFWEPRNVGDSAVFDLGKPATIASVQYHNGLGSGEFSLEYSLDGVQWVVGSPIVNDNAFAEMRWRTVQDFHAARYFRIGLVRGRQQLNELALYAPDGSNIAVVAEVKSETVAEGDGNAARLFDEPTTQVKVSDYTNGMYFDEVYFARSAWEILQGRNATENTHPPLGKIIIAGSVAVLGMNPFAYRLPGTLFGIAMLPVMYLLALRLFRQRRWAFLAALLLAVDFMHFTQTRIATVDTFVMLFVLSAYYWMIRWRQDAAEPSPDAKSGLNPLWCLVFSGVSIALGMATKWTAVYAAAGLAVLFFVGFFQLGSQWINRRNWKTIFMSWLSFSFRQNWKTLLTCLVAFVAIPCLIYVCAYIPLMSVTGSGLTGILDNQSSMWNYHSQMKDSHPFSSQWYQWPIMVKPIWYYSGGANVAPDLASTIIAFGNPLVWFLGSAAFLFLLGYLAVNWVRSTLGRWQLLPRLPAATGAILFNRQTVLIIIISGLAQYLPWAMIPRKLVFIYHFFLTVPFIILALVFVGRWIAERVYDSGIGRNLWWIIGALAALLFILYFPTLGGTPFPRWWAEGLKMLGIPIYF